MALGVLEAILAAVFLAVASMSATPLPLRLILGPLGSLLAYGCRANLAYGRANTARGFDERLRWDPRPPILFLRSFRDDLMQMRLRWYERLPVVQRILGEGVAFEEVVDRALRRYGPVTAIGQPGDALPPVGAARKYVPNEQWKNQVQDFTERCHLIVVMIGNTQGLTWEARRLAEYGLLVRTILVLPPVGWIESDGRWRDFYNALRDLPELSFPPSPPEGALVATFDPAGNCRFVTGRVPNIGAYKRALRRAVKAISQPGLPG